VMRINAAMLLPAPNPAAPQISSADYQDVASDLGIETAVIQAVAEVEAGSGKKGFDQKGRPIILFEGYWFHKFTGGQFDSHYPYLSSPTWQVAKKYYNRDQWERMYEAMMLDYISAWKAASWGLFQVMGFNHSGSATISSFVKAMFTSEGEHLRSFAAYCKDTDLITALKNKDWAAFARGYNGAGYKQNQYDTKMEQAYKKYVKAATKAAGTQQK
jgi:N-acetylmuramidase-like protein